MLMVVWIKHFQSVDHPKLESGPQLVVLIHNIGWQADETIQGGEDAEEITVTDGTLTISLGDGSFISSQSTVAGGVAAGNVAALE